MELTPNSHWVSRLMFHDWSHTTFTILYAVVFILIVTTFIVVPPRWRSTPAVPSAKLNPVMKLRQQTLGAGNLDARMVVRLWVFRRLSERRSK